MPPPQGRDRLLLLRLYFSADFPRQLNYFPGAHVRTKVGRRNFFFGNAPSCKTLINNKIRDSKEEEKEEKKEELEGSGN